MYKFFSKISAIINRKMSVSENIVLEDSLLSSVLNPHYKVHKESGKNTLFQKVSFPSATNSSW